MSARITNRHFQNNRNLNCLAERVCNWVKSNRQGLRCSERPGSLWSGLTRAKICRTTDHDQSVHWRKVSADVLGIGPLQYLQRCGAALWRWNRRTGTHPRGAWALNQGAAGYPVRNLPEVANDAQGMMKWRCAVVVSKRSWLHTIASSVAMLTRAEQWVGTEADTMAATVLVSAYRTVGSYRS